MSAILGNKKIFLFIILLFFCIYSSILIIRTSSIYNSDDSLVLLANQFLNKHISLAPGENMPLGDLAIYNGKYYLYFGPFSSIILMPFVLFFGMNIFQGIIGISSIIFIFFIVFALTIRFRFNNLDSLFLSLFFTFSTVIFSSALINISAYQVSVLGVPFVLLSLYEYFSQKRPLIIGLFLALAFLTRFILILSLVFFFVEFLQKRISFRKILLMFIPILVSLIIFGMYNYVRFDSLVESGYSYAMAGNTFPVSKNFEEGAISLVHIPANLYSFLIMPPEPLLLNKNGFVLKFPYLKANPWGMAIWFTSPLFFFLFKFKKWKYSLSALLAFITLSVPAFLFYSIGFAQFGYRYALDFLPFLFLLLIPNLQPKLSKTAIILITIGIFFNCIFITSLWEVYPLFGI